ncbi:hypothetical protein GQ53DRAFT_304875 [Thozetella sp. PMI_491]|nr:hypothetical protein GQ53DRAFT_304875 [Thozetella sp. PMI_491]
MGLIHEPRRSLLGGAVDRLSAAPLLLTSSLPLVASRVSASRTCGSFPPGMSFLSAIGHTLCPTAASVPFLLRGKKHARDGTGSARLEVCIVVVLQTDQYWEPG